MNTRTKTRKRPRTAITLKYSFSLTRACRVLACLLPFLTSSALPQVRERPKPADYALIFGTVWGPDDLALPGVKVKIRRSVDKKARWEVYSNRRGEFELRVPAGKQDYVIWADIKGYKLGNGNRLQPSPEITVHVENNERADTGLHLK
jgi:hypothetical protein